MSAFSRTQATAFSWTPVLAGISILGLLTFLFVQAQRVDRVNALHASVVQLLQTSQQLDGELRQGLVEVYYGQHHNFDLLTETLNRQESLLDALGSERFRVYQQDRSGVEYYLSRLVNLHHERLELVSDFMQQTGLLKNALRGLNQPNPLASLADELPQLAGLFERYAVLMRAFGQQPNESLAQQGRQLQPLMAQALVSLQQRGVPDPIISRSRLYFQHGSILFESRILIEKLLDQLQQQPSEAVRAQLTQVYLDFHDQQERIASYYRIGLFASGALLLVFVVMTLLRLRNTATHLLEEKERAEVTLGSIGDGVIATDRQGRVNYMNRAAEKLTGLTLEQACGQPFEAVLPLVSEITHQPISCPARRCIENESVVELQNHIYMVRNDGKQTHLEVNASPIGQLDERPLGAVLVVQDVGEAQILAEKLTYETAHDALTGLLNRMTFAQKIQQQLDSAEVSHQSPILWHIDLDHFSVINDICGAKGGDAFLRTIAGELKRAVGEQDQLSRIGGDEFAILRPNADPADALSLARRLRELINGIRFEWEDTLFDTTATIGVVFLKQDYLDISDVLMAAKSAVDSAREQGRNNIYIHTKEVYEKSRKHELSQWVPRIKRALNDNRYRLYLQSIAPVTADGCLTPHHVEVLLRMEDEQGKIVPPLFIPAAEEYNLMPQLDRWVIEQVCERIAEAHRLQLPHRDTCYSVNLSGTTLGDSFFLSFIRQLFERLEIPTAQICFEITETAAIRNIDAAMLFINSARELGCQFALDDFGSGMSSFGYLQNLPVDYLKIDGAFVKRLAEDPVQYRIVEAINTVGQTLKMKTIAEFVENDAIIRGLSEIGVDYAQGYGIDAPMLWEHYFEQRNQPDAVAEPEQLEQ